MTLFSIALLLILGLSHMCSALDSRNTCTISRTTFDTILSSTNASSKAGLAWPNGNFDDYKQYTSTGKVSWYYTWSPNVINADLEFVPMLWGEDQVQAFSSTIDETISQNKVSAVLGMNEPEQGGQSNLTPAQGADMWKSYIQPLKSQGLRLGTPAPSSAPSGKTWIQDWISVCDGGCTPDFVALHWYDINATQFQLYLEDFHNAFDLPIWVTEWACQVIYRFDELDPRQLFLCINSPPKRQNYNNGPQCTQEEVVEFLNQTQSFMDSTPWVEWYAWFGVMENLQGVNSVNAMMDQNGHITALGEQYIGENGDSVQLSRAIRTHPTHLQLILAFTTILLMYIV
ncbi:hypothetical protein SCHPADRAFT_464382 [Schizopora paradoxa]|uniref:Asl1-like glycosyl hydrolase catalytic domain-containing protein n=1 Tax=Schizopora paradoxa TaxID=27342 RepID=A0A0H2S3V2_9AGAM|nr:hypothetical protein SCHPADRAFT_464382 [Schizopora paradoxa]